MNKYLGRSGMAPDSAFKRSLADELLAALVELVERAEAEGNIDGLPEYDQARAAISRAKGAPYTNRPDKPEGVAAWEGEGGA